MGANSVMIMTPSHDLAQSLWAMLHPAGYELKVCAPPPEPGVPGADTAVSCVVVDWDARGEFSSPVMAGLKDEGVPAAAVLLASSSNIRGAMIALRHGASDLLEKPVDPGQLRASVAEAIDRRARLIRLQKDITMAREALAELNPREQQLVTGIVAGLTSREIAEATASSVRTVETSRTRLLAKLGVNNTASLVRIAVLADLPIPSASHADEAWTLSR